MRPIVGQDADVGSAADTSKAAAAGDAPREQNAQKPSSLLPLPPLLQAVGPARLEPGAPHSPQEAARVAGTGVAAHSPALRAHVAPVCQVSYACATSLFGVCMIARSVIGTRATGTVASVVRLGLMLLRT